MAEQEIERSLTALLKIGDKLNSTFDLDGLLDALIEQLLELTDAESGCAGLRTAYGMSCSSFRQGTSTVTFTYDGARSAGWPEWVLTHKAHYSTSDAVSDELIAPEVRQRFSVKSGMSMPILDSRNEVIAFFEVYNKKSDGGFTQQDLVNSQAAAQIASLAIQNALTYRKLVALAAFSRSLTLAGDLEQVLAEVAHHVAINFQRGSVILLAGEGGLTRRYQTPEFVTSPEEVEATTWCWEHIQETGASTSIVPHAAFYYLPLTVRDQCIGVLGMESKPGAWFSALQRDLLAGLVAQSALAMERALLEQKLRRLRFLGESDRVQNALLTAISHEVRAPLAAITAALSGLLNSDLSSADSSNERQLLRTADHEAKRLHRLMNNLLSVTRLEAGMSRLKIEPCDLADVIGAALEELGAPVQSRKIYLDIPEDLPLIPMDFTLITQVLVNLLSNAVKFSSPSQPIQLRSRLVDEGLEVAVVDQGIGVPEADIARVFHKFQTLAEPNTANGLGLGLSICKEFVEAHGGRIILARNPLGGTIAAFVLPIQP
jgi:two-component system sensor histidine kinase KdpD